MTTPFQTSNFKVQSSNKLAYSAEASLAAKAGQISNFKFYCLVFGCFLNFGVWCLNFKRPKGVL